MDNKINLELRKRPSDISTLFKAFRSRKNRFSSAESIPAIHLKRSGLKISKKHLKSFNTICEINPTRGLHILYPFTLVYPYLMRILCRQEMPFSIFKSLNTRNHIVMFRTIDPGENLEIECYNTTSRILPKGIEFDFRTEVYSGSEKVWENTATYYLPVRSKNPEASTVQPRLEPLQKPIIINEWHLNGKNRFRFARVSGDTNGIHYSANYARMFGFKRDFAQPIRIISRCVSSLPGGFADHPAELDFFIKGPVYYESMLTLKNEKNGENHRFDLFCENNDKPCMCAQLVPIK